MKKLLLILFVFLVSLQSIAQVTYIEGEVVEIIDGKRFKLLTKDATPYTIIVANIDCPNLDQPFGTKAKQFTSNAILNKSVKVEVINIDKKGRPLGIVLYNGSSNLNEELLRNGLAWHFVRYSNDSTLQALEDEAKTNKIGLWQDIDPVKPWDWREANSISPIYPGCNRGNNDAKRKCMSVKISKLVKNNFNQFNDVTLDHKGIQKINVIFKINKEGNITDVRAKVSRTDLEAEFKAQLEAEAIRIIKLTPKMRPGSINGKPVVVPYSLLIQFSIR